MEITTYAPVAIPTLNRYEHLKRLLESLERCKGADHTEVYVSLDYPPLDSNGEPAKKYVEGWKKSDEYLAQKELSNGFKKLIVFRHDKNIGITGPVTNYSFVYGKVLEKYDRYIATEDDNEFSPCFLEYMNQNLEKYKDDSTVFRICGYLSFKETLSKLGDYTQFKADRHVAWGLGCWKHKKEGYNKFATRENIIKLAKDKRVIDYFEKDKLETILTSIVKMSKGSPILGDVIVAAYLAYSNSRCILPTKSMVRNHGWDGTGQHGGYAPGYKEQEICTNYDYVMNEAPAEFTEEFEREMHRKRSSKKRDIRSFASMVTWYLYKYTGIFCEFKIAHDICKKIKNTFNGK